MENKYSKKLLAIYLLLKIYNLLKSTSTNNKKVVNIL